MNSIFENNKNLRLGFDADGVVVDSRHLAWLTAGKIVELFAAAGGISSHEEYRQRFSKTAQEALAGPAGAPTLRELHRLVMKARASELLGFPKVLAVVAQLKNKPHLITAAYSSGILTALRGSEKYFESVVGREDGDKGALLRAAARNGLNLYVTDGVRDVERCHECGVSVIGVAWGYSTAESLRAAGAEYVVKTPEQLLVVFNELGLTE